MFDYADEQLFTCIPNNKTRIAVMPI